MMTDKIKPLDNEQLTAPREFEPGLLPLFRILVVLVMVLLALRAGLTTALGANVLLPSAVPGLVVLALLLVYLFSTRLQRLLGRAYLPLALTLFVALALAGSSAGLRLKAEAGMALDEQVRGTWVTIVLLVVPLVIVAWQYGFRWVLGFCLLTAGAELVLLLPLATRGGPPPASLLAIVLVRTIVLLPVGYAVARLMEAQRRQRSELAQAHAQLARYAGTLEQITAERERSRLAHELHDTLAHGLSSIAVQLEAITALWSTQADKARSMLAEALATTRHALGESRRAIAALRASPLEDLGLVPALRQLAQTTATRAGLALTLDLPAEVVGLKPDTEQAVYRIAGEALANSVRHAEARTLTLKLQDRSDALELTVADDGRGFDATQKADDGHFGLYGMHERARMIGAQLIIESNPGRGTTLRLLVRRTDDTRPDL